MALTWVTTKLPSIYIDKAYTIELVGAGGTAPYSFSTITALPTGLALVGNTISGTVINGALKGPFSISLRLTDSVGATVVLRTSVEIRTESNKIDYKLDSEVESALQVIQHNDPNQDLHPIIGKLLYWGLDSTEEEIVNGQATLIENWVNVVSGATADTNLRDVLFNLAAWTNNVAYPVEETIPSYILSPGAIAEFTISSASSDIYVGTDPLQYVNYFLLSNSSYEPLFSSALTQFVITSVTPVAVVDGATTSVVIQAQYSPNPSAEAPPAAPFVCILGKVSETRSLPDNTVVILYRLFKALVDKLISNGLHQINGVSPSGKILYLMGGNGLGIFESDAVDTIAIDSPTIGLTNESSEDGTKIQGRGLGLSSEGDGQIMLSLKGNSYSQMFDHNGNSTNRAMIQNNTPSIESMQIFQSMRSGSLRSGAYKSFKNGSNEYAISKRGVQGNISAGAGGPPAYASILSNYRGDSPKTFSERALRWALDPSAIYWYGTVFNALEQPSFSGKFFQSISLAFTAMGLPPFTEWYGDLEEFFTTLHYVNNVITSDTMDQTKAFLWVAPMLEAVAGGSTVIPPVVEFVSYHYDPSAGWTRQLLTTFTPGGGGFSLVAGSPIGGTYYDDLGAIAPPQTVTLDDPTGGTSEWVINAGLTTFPSSWNTWVQSVIGEEYSGPVIIVPESGGVAGTPTMFWFQSSAIGGAKALSNFSLLSSIPERLISGIGYYPGTFPLRCTFTIDEVGVYDVAGKSPIVLDYGAEFTSLRHGAVHFQTDFVLRSGTDLDFLNYYDAGVTIDSDSIVMQDLLGSVGFLESGTAATDNIINMYYAGAKMYDVKPIDAGLGLQAEHPIAFNNVNGILTGDILGQFTSGEQTEVFIDEHYRIDLSDHGSATKFIETKQPDNGVKSLYGWNNEDDLPAGTLQVGVISNPGQGDSYTVRGRSFEDNAYWIPGLFIPREDYTTTRSSYSGTNYDYSDVKYDVDGVYYRVFNLKKPATTISAIQVYGWDITAGVAISSTEITNGDIQIEVKIPESSGSSVWVDATAGALSNLSWGGNAVGLQISNLGLGANSTLGHYNIVMRVTIPYNAGAGEDYIITGIRVIP